MNILYRPSATLPEDIKLQLADISHRERADYSIMIDIIDMVSLAALKGREQGFTKANSLAYTNGYPEIFGHLANLFDAYKGVDANSYRDRIDSAFYELGQGDLVLRSALACGTLTLSEDLEAAIFSDWVKP